MRDLGYGEDILTSNCGPSMTKLRPALIREFF